MIAPGRQTYLEQVESLARRVVVAWPLFQELEDYVEFEVAMAALKRLLDQPPASPAVDNSRFLSGADREILRDQYAAIARRPREGEKRS